MRRLFKVSLSLALVALLASPALAQRQRQPRQPGGGGGRGMGQNLLLNKSVQEELKLTKDQQEKLAEVSKTTREKMQEAFQGLRDLKPEERTEKLTALRKEADEAIKKAVTLTSKQSARLKEIQLQQRGIRAFEDAEVQKKLNLTDDQKAALKTILTERDDKIKEETKDLTGREAFQKGAEIRRKLNKEAMGKVADKLNAEQKKNWSEMVGEPFEVKFEQRTRPGGGGRPGGGRPGGTPPRIDL